MAFHWDDTDYRHPFGRIRHYYGDVVRQLFFGLAIVIAAFVPFSGDIHFGLSVGVPTVIVLVLLAGLTSPHGKLVMMANVAVSIVGVVGGQWYALLAYSEGAYVPFVVLEFVSIGFLAGMYYGVKTLRAMDANILGKREPPEDVV